VRSQIDAGLGALPGPEHHGIAGLRSALWSAGYEADHVREVFGATGDNLTPSASQALMLRRELEPGTPLTGLLTLFLLGLPLSVALAAAALTPLNLPVAQEMGLVEVEGDAVRAAIRLVPYAGFIFASGLEPESRAVDRNHVMGITRSTITLANLTLRHPVELALDLGCGTGVQALLASRHATRVVATDLNPTACRVTAFNARLNRVDNLEVREGSYFDPVEDLRFDLVVTNPPFVISPDNRFLYRDGGVRGDEVSHEVLEGVSRHLRPGGLATVLISWGRREGEDWFVRPSEWSAGLGCDVLLLHQATQTALAHSASWHGALAGADQHAYEEGIERWTAHLAELGFDGIGYGAVVLRRREGDNWLRAEEIPGHDAGPADVQLRAMVEAQDALVPMDAQGVLASRPALVPNHHLEQLLRCRDGQFEVESAVLGLEDGLAFRANVDAFNAYLLSRLDGSRTLREAVAASMPLAPEGAPVAEVEASAARAARRMLELGFLRLRPER
jgi:methylase of polypeptide subunit release factors